VRTTKPEDEDRNKPQFTPNPAVVLRKNGDFHPPDSLQQAYPLLQQIAVEGREKRRVASSSTFNGT